MPVVPDSHVSHWVIRSNVMATRGLSLLFLILGLILTVKAQSPVDPSSARFMAQVLGILLICGPLLFLVFLEDIQISVDPQNQRMRIRRANWFRSKLITRAFSELADVRTLKHGRSSQGIVIYTLLLEFQDGQRLNPGLWSFSPQTIDRIVERLILETGCQATLPAPRPSLQSNDLILPAIGAVATYVVWYRIQVGPWCLAMWHGTAPIFIMGVAFVSIFIWRRI